jgi:ATP-dependent helicase/DNAse subunit B
MVSLPANNYKTRYLFNALRSPYFDLRLSATQVDELEKTSRMFKIVEGQDQWQDTWEHLVFSRLPEQEALDEELDLPDLPPGTTTSELQEALTAMFTELEPPEGERSYLYWVGWFEDLLERVCFYKKAEGDRAELVAGESSQALRTLEVRDRVVCEAIREVLRSLVASETVVGERQVVYTDFLEDLVSSLVGSTLPEVRHWDSQALFVGRMIEARGLRFKAVAILGLSEGVFPVVERPDPILDEGLRLELGLEPRLQREQAGLFYQAITRADEYLLLTRPYLAEGGEAWEESPYWLEMKRLLPPSAIRTIRPDDARPLTEAASAQELLFTGVRRKGIISQFIALQERFTRLRYAREVLHARRTRAADGPFEGAALEIGISLQKRYPQSVPWSASRLEQYGTCPFYFYVNTALGLEPCELPEFGLDAAQLGSILHKILEETFKLTQNKNDTESLLDTLRMASRRVFASAPQTYAFRPSALWQTEQVQLHEALEKTITELTAQSEGWEPFAFECRFGIGDKPPLRLEQENGQVLLHGVIDRVDRRSDGAIRVIDYKSGSSHLANADLVNGRRLQLPLYALAACDALGLGNVVDGWYWKILASGASALKLDSFRSPEGQGIEAAYSTLYAHLERILTGIRKAAFPPVPPTGGCPSYCPAAGWCWRYESSGW